MLIEAGLEMFDQSGMRPSFDAVTLERAVRVSGVPRSTAYHIYSSDTDERAPQEAFQFEVVRRLLADATEDSSTDALSAAAAAAFEEATARGDKPPEVLREVIRRASNAHLASLDDRRSLGVSYALLAGAQSVPIENADLELLGWLREADIDWRTRLSEGVFSDLAAVIGATPKPEFNAENFWSQFTTALIALGDGLYIRQRISDEAAVRSVVPAEADLEGWSLYALGVEALVWRFFDVPAEWPDD